MVTKVTNGTNTPYQVKTASGKIFSVNPGETLSLKDDYFTHQKWEFETRFSKIKTGYGA